MQKSRKLSLFLKQTKSNYFFLKQLSNFLKVPKVHFDRTRSMNLQMHNDAQEAITQNNEGIKKKTKQLTESNKKSYWFSKIKKHTFSFFVNEKQEDYNCNFSMIK